LISDNASGGLRPAGAQSTGAVTLRAICNREHRGSADHAKDSY